VKFLSLQDRAVKAMKGLRLTLGAHALGVVLHVLGGVVSATAIAPALLGLAGVVQGASILFCAATFLPWWHRAYGNLGPLQWGTRRTSAGWAVGGFFVPLLNLVLPYQAGLEIWNGSVGAVRKARQQEPERWSASPVNAWWYAWLGSALLMMQGARTQSGLFAGLMAAGASALAVVSARHALLLVEGVTELQDLGAVALTARAQDRPVVPGRDPLRDRGVSAGTEAVAPTMADPLAHLK